MSQPYRPSSEYRSPYPSPPPQVKRRPSAAWFAVGGVLLVVAAVVFGIAVFNFVSTVSHSDAVFRASGSHAVTLPPGDERGLFVPEGQPIPACQVTDGSGAALHFRRPEERFTYGEWVVVRVFDTGDGNVVFACPPGLGGRIRVAEVPSGGDFARLGFVGLLLPLGIGGLGFVILLVTTILWITRRPAPPAPTYGVAPGYPPGHPPTYPPTYQPTQPPAQAPDEPLIGPTSGSPETPPEETPPPG